MSDTTVPDNIEGDGQVSKTVMGHLTDAVTAVFGERIGDALSRFIPEEKEKKELSDISEVKEYIAKEVEGTIKRLEKGYQLFSVRYQFINDMYIAQLRLTIQKKIITITSIDAIFDKRTLSESEKTQKRLQRISLYIQDIFIQMGKLRPMIDDINRLIWEYENSITLKEEEEEFKKRTKEEILMVEHRIRSLIWDEIAKTRDIHATEAQNLERWDLINEKKRKRTKLLREIQEHNSIKLRKELETIDLEIKMLVSEFDIEEEHINGLAGKMNIDTKMNQKESGNRYIGDHWDAIVTKFFPMGPIDYIDYFRNRLNGIRYQLIINPIQISGKQIGESTLNIEHQPRSNDEKYINHKRYKKIRLQLGLTIDGTIAFNSQKDPETSFFIDYDRLRQGILSVVHFPMKTIDDKDPQPRIIFEGTIKQMQCLQKSPTSKKFYINTEKSVPCQKI